MILNTGFILTLLYSVCASLSPNANGTELPKKVFTTNYLQGFKKDFPTIWPPGIGGPNAHKRVILDIGSNNGDQYTLLGRKQGHTIFSFEPSPMLAALFNGVLTKNGVEVSVVKLLPSVLKKIYESNSRITIPAGAESREPKVYLIPVALSNRTGAVMFHESPCRDLSKCGKVNHIVADDSKATKVTVPGFRLDDIVLPLQGKQVWFVKIDVEGHELQVLQGARDFLKKTKTPYVAVEFSNNGRPGIDWGVELLEEMHSQGYLCHHLRGFGKCHDSSFRTPSLKCNYPFDVDNPQTAPSFEEYSEVFEQRRKKKRSMADLMCIHERVLRNRKKRPTKQSSGDMISAAMRPRSSETLHVSF